jgi:hypothetical protein
MTSLRLFVCCYLSAFAYTVWAGGPQANENALSDRNDLASHKQEKFAGRANNVSAVNAAANKNSNAKYSLNTQEAHEKKPLSKEEKSALRRQINETESMYPKRN